MKNRIRELRKAREITIAQLAEKVGLSTTHVSNIEKHQRGLEIGWLEPFAKALDVNPIDLLEGDWNQDAFEVSNISGVKNFALAQRGNVTFSAGKEVKHIDILEEQLLKLFNELELNKRINLIYKLQNNELSLD